MTDRTWDFVGKENRHFSERSIGDAVRGLVRRRWNSNAAKMLERHWDLDPKTARNVVGQGNVSERTLTKAVRAEGWSFLAALGEELTGQSYAEHLQSIIEREADVQRDRESQRDAVRRMETRARDLGRILDGPTA